MADLNGKPVLWHVIERVKRATRVHQVVVASPDLELVEYANYHQAWGFHFPQEPENVLMRYIKAAHWAGAEIVVRITADCPLICPEIIDDCVKGYLDNRVDISTNVLRRSFMKGLDVEVTHPNVLKRIFHLTNDPRYRQHVTLYAYENPALFAFKNISHFNDYSFINVCCDADKDLDNLKGFFDTVDSMNYGYPELLRYFASGER